MKQSLLAWVRPALRMPFRFDKAQTAPKRAITTTLFFWLMLCVAQAQPWTQLPVTAPITSNSELGIHFVDDQIGYVVGTNGLASKTTNGGTTWTTLTSINASSTSLYSTYFIDALTGFVVGDAGFIKRTDDGGTTWQAVAINNTSTNPAPAAGTDYRGVWFYNAYIGFIVGGISQVSGTILKTNDGGLTWTNISPPQNPGAGRAFYGIFFTSALNGYACDFDGRILKTIDGGTIWNLLYTSVGNHLNGLYFLNATHGFAVGGISPSTGILLETTDGGTTWSNKTTNVLSGSANTNFLSDIKFFGNTGFIVGGNVTANTGVIYKTNNANSISNNNTSLVTWTKETTNPTPVKRLVSASLPCSHTGYADGLNGTILKVTGINEKICCDSFNNTFLNTNFTYSNSFNTYTFTKSTGTTTGDVLTWDFGDGQTSTAQSPTHTYPSVSNSYLATLTIVRPQVGGDTCRVKLCKLIDTKPCPNMVVNGDFSMGNTGFTTGLPRGQRCTPALCEDGSYCIGNDFTSKCSINTNTTWPSTYDHTIGTAAGSFMSIDGNTTVAGPIDIWRYAPVNTIPVTPGITYKFTFWAKSVYTANQQALNLEMAITDNNTTGSITKTKIITISQSPINWTEYNMIWICPANVSTVNLAIRQLTPAAFSDFGIDDISFSCVNCEDFMTDVINYGIQSTLVSGNTYKYCVSPNVSTSDIVQWDLDCNGTIDATTNTPCQNFTLTSANSQICATVLHVIKPGDTCRVKVNTCLPRIVTAQACACDTTFNNNLSRSFTWVKTTPYSVTFTPNRLLNNCDSIRWTASGISGFIGTSSGSGSITYTFPSTPGTYQVCMIVARTTPTGLTCKGEVCSSITLSGSLQALDIEMPKLIVRPNPTSNSTSISVPPTLNNKKNSVRITSLEGRTMLVTSVESVEMTLHLDTLPSGMYFLSLFDEKGNMLTQPTKFVKQ